MSALTQARTSRIQTVKTVPFLLAASQTAYQGGRACGDTSTGTVKPGQASTTLIPLGRFARSFDNSAGTASVQCLVELDRELECEWLDNATAGGNPVVASSLFNACYILDDHTVTMASSGNSKAGLVLAVDSVKGVLVFNNQSF